MTTVFKTFFKPRANNYTTKQLILLKGFFFLKFCTNDYVTMMCFYMCVCAYIHIYMWNQNLYIFFGSTYK